MQDYLHKYVPMAATKSGSRYFKAGNFKWKIYFPWQFSVFLFFSFYLVQKNGMSHPGQPTNLLCPFLVPQCSTYLPTQNRDVINGCSLIIRPLMLSLDPVEHFLIKRGQAYIRGSKWIYAKYNYVCISIMGLLLITKGICICQR